MEKFIVIKTGNKYKKVFVNDIIYCKANGAYTEIYFADGTVFLTSNLLKDIEEKLRDANFYRINRTYLANLNHCHEICKNGSLEIVFTSGAKLPVSRSRYKELLEKFFVHS